MILPYEDSQLFIYIERGGFLGFLSFFPLCSFSASMTLESRKLLPAFLLPWLWPALLRQMKLPYRKFACRRNMNYLLFWPQGLARVTGCLEIVICLFYFGSRSTLTSTPHIGCLFFFFKRTTIAIDN
ncbi:hypothetical protein GGI35DRAFT_448245, partial [Trichoderma velutinum]